jgi:hypothetical protein
VSDERTEALIGDLQAQLDEHRAALTALLGEVRQLHKAGADRSSQQRPPVPSWSWEELAGDARRQAWRQLAAWVDWLVTTYRLERWWSEEWYRHRGVVEEVKGLRGFHLAVAGEPERGPGYVDWHEALWSFAARAPQLMADQHPGRAPLGAARWEPTAGSPAFERFVEEEVAARR